MIIGLDRCDGSCNIFDDASGIICVTNNTENVNFNVCTMLTGIDYSKTLTKHISGDCKCESDGKK